MVLMMFNLFSLHDIEHDKTPRNWIKLGGKNLVNKIKNLLIEIQSSGPNLSDISQALAEKINASSYTIAKQLREILKQNWEGRQNYVPIPLIDSLVQLYKPNHYEKIKLEVTNLTEKLICNTSRAKPIKAVKELSCNLCRIAGAHAADGTLHISKTAKNSYYYVWGIVDQDKRALLELKRWISKTFGLKTIIKKSKYENSFYISVSNKIIVRYLSKILGFPLGKKTHIVAMPEIIKNSNLKMRKNFSLGVLTFDGCVDIHGYMRLSVKSKALCDSVAETMKKDKLKVVYRLSRRGEYTLKIRILKNNTKLLGYFAKNTLQFLRANIFIKGSTPNLELFDGNSNNKIRLKEVMREIKSLKIFTITSLENRLRVSKRTLRAYLKVLEQMNLVKIMNSGTKVDGVLSSANIDETTPIKLKNGFLNQLFKTALLKAKDQRTLAQIIGAYPSYIWEWKNGRAIELGYLRKLLQFCDMDLGESCKNINSLGKNIYTFKNS